MHLEPIELSQDQLEHIWSRLGSADLVDILTEWGYERRLVEKVQHLPSCRALDLYLTKYRNKWIERQFRHLLKGDLERQIVEENLDLYTLLLLSQQPQLVRRLERHWSLNETGDICALVRNYVSWRYTYRLAKAGHIFTPYDPARWGHRDIVDMWLQRDVYSHDELENAILTTTEHGHLDLMAYMFDVCVGLYPKKCNSQNLLKGIYVQGAKHGHVPIVEFAIKNGADSFDDGIFYAIHQGHQEMIDYLISTQGDRLDPNKVMILAATHGDLGLVRRMIQLGADNFDSAIEAAIWRYGKYHRKVVEFLFFYVSDWNRVLLAACLYGYDDLVATVLDQPGLDYHAAIVDACYGLYTLRNEKKGYRRVANMLMSKIPDELERYIILHNENDRIWDVRAQRAIIYRWVNEFRYREVNPTRDTHLQT